MRWLRFRPTGKSLLRSSRPSRCMLLHRRGQLGMGATLFPGPLAFTPDGTVARRGRERLSLALDPGRRALLYGVVKVWDAHEGRVLARLTGQPSWIRSVSVSPDGTTIAVAGDASTIELWDLRSRSRRKVLEGHVGRIGKVVFSPDGGTLASADWNGEVRLWDVSTGRTRLELRVSQYGARELAFSPDGAKLATGDGVALRLWDTRNGHELRSIDGQNLNFLGFTDAGKSFLIARYRVRHNGAVTIIDGATMAEKLDLMLQLHSCGVRLSSDGRWIAVPERDGSVTVRDASSGQVLRGPPGCPGRRGTSRSHLVGSCLPPATTPASSAPGTRGPGCDRLGFRQRAGCSCGSRRRWPHSSGHGRHSVSVGSGQIVSPKSNHRLPDKASHSPVSRARFGETHCYDHEMADHNRGHVDLDLHGNRHRTQISPPAAKASQGNGGLASHSDLPRDHRQHQDCHRVAFE